ncbi:MAG: AsmA family protein [Gammaproteobacteria bacterium]|nr:AsmA family protein [Gammaproteobacteria bacterium]
MAKRIFLIFSAIFLIAIVTVITLLMTADPGRFKDEIAGFVSKQIGYSLSVNGSLEITLGREITIRAEQLSLHNPNGDDAQLLASAKRLHLVTDLWSWWAGPVIFERIEISDGQLNFEQTKEGVTNWDTPGTAGDRDDDQDPGFVLNDIRVKNIQLNITDPRLKKPVAIAVNSLDQGQLETGLLNINVDGNINDKIFNIKGEYGPLATLISGENLNYDLNGTFDTLSISSKGTLDQLTSPARPTIELNISGPNVDHITNLLGISDLGNGGIQFKADLEPGRDALETKINATIGDYSLNINGPVASLQDYSSGNLKISSKGPSLKVIAELFNIDGIAEGEYKLSGEIAKRDSLLTINNVLVQLGQAKLSAHGEIRNFPKLNDSTLDVNLSGQDFARFRKITGLPGPLTGPFDSQLQLERNSKGEQEIQLLLSAAGITSKVSGNLGAKLNLEGSKLNLNIKGNNMSTLTSAYGLPGKINEPFTIDGNVEINNEESMTLKNIVWRFGSNRIVLDGKASYKAMAEGTLMNINVSGDDFSIISKVIETERAFPAEPYKLSGKLGVQIKQFQITDGRLEIGKHKLSVSGDIGRNKEYSDTRLTVSAQGPNLQKAASSFTDLALPETEYQFSGVTQISATDFFLQGLSFSTTSGKGLLNASIGRPVESGSGQFNLKASGADINEILPKIEHVKPDSLNFKIDATGSWKPDAWELTKVAVTLGDSTIKASGTFDKPPDLSQTKLQLDISIQDLSKLGLINDYRLPANNFLFQGGFTGASERVVMENISAQSGNSSITGRLEIMLDESKPTINAQFKSPLLDLQPIWAYEKESETNSPNVSDNRLIPDWDIPTAWLDLLNTNVALEAKEVHYGHRTWNEFVLHAALKNSELEVDKVKAVTEYGNLDAKLNIRKAPNQDAIVSAELSGSDMPLNYAGGKTEQDIADAPKYNGIINLNGTGDTFRDLTANLDGNVQLISDGGKINNSGLTLVYGDFVMGLLGKINPFFKEEPYTNVSCIAIILEVADGKINAAPGIVAQTDKLNIASNGKIDLRTEKVDMNFRTSARRGIGISAGQLINPYIRVGGTLNDPRLAIDKTGALVTGGAAVATAGLSILATTVWDRVFRQKNPCQAVVTKYTEIKEST